MQILDLTYIILMYYNWVFCLLNLKIYHNFKANFID